MPQIAHVAYVVEPRSRGWTIVSGHMAAGDFETRRAALRAARQDASFCRSLGHDVSLFATRRDGRLGAIAIPSWDVVCANDEATLRACPEKGEPSGAAFDSTQGARPPCQGNVSIQRLS